MTLDEYIEQHSSPESNALSQITHDTNVYQLNPHMLSGQVQGRVLAMLSQMIKPEYILELGTFTGYSALCLAEGLTDNGELHTIEYNDELEDTIMYNFSLSPLGKKIHLHVGDALQLLADNGKGLDMKNDILFDLVFIDADKREYSDYFNLVFPLVKKGGFILADNTLWDGHIIDSAYDHDKQTLGLRSFNDLVRQDTRVEKVILPLRDGLTIIRKK
ncbi:MAG: O-methyltransferase [Paludibacteraceae bacterium]|nr:O-methyltransferase [Paludibacteraceae bacterium]